MTGAIDAHLADARPDAVLPADARPDSGTPIDAAMIPDTVITSAPAAISSSTTATLVFNSPNTPNATFQCALNTSTFTPCTSPQVYTGLTDGTYTFQVAAINSAGVVDPTPAVATWVIDTTGPGIIITSGPPNGGITGQNVTFTYVVTPAESPVTYQCQLDSGAFVSCSATGQTYNNLPLGSMHDFCVHATDEAGNVGPTVCSTFTVESAPVVTIQTPANGSTVGTSFGLTFTSTIPPGTYFCTFDGAQVGSSCTSPHPFTGVAIGVHTITVIETDSNGIMSNLATTTFTVAQSPIVSIILPTNNEIVPANGDITYDPGTSVTVTCTLDGAAVSCTIGGTYPYTNLTQGPHTFTVHGVNSVGEGSNTATVTFIVDTTPPGIAFTTPPTPLEGATVGQVPAFQFQVSPAEPPSTTYLCNFDSLPAFSCNLNTPYVPSPAFSSGPHMFTVVGTDIAGNTATIVRHVIVDNAPPTLVFVTPPTPTEGEIVNPTPPWEFHVVSMEPGTTVYSCQFDSDTPFVNGCTPDTVLTHATPFATGPHQLAVTGTDVAGNHATIVRHVMVVAGECTPGQTRPCYDGPDGTEGVGICQAGTQVCGDDMNWPAGCSGEVVPRTEATNCVDGIDNDCNGLTDCNDPACSTDPCCLAAALGPSGGTGDLGPSGPVDVTITADNAYSFGYGDGTEIETFFQGTRASLAGQIFNCPVGNGPEFYSVPSDAAPPSALLYIVSWDDLEVTQGVLGQFKRATGTLYTGDERFQVCATGLDYSGDSPIPDGAGDPTNGPTLDVINQQIAICDAGSGDPTTTSAGWVDATGAVTPGANGTLAIGPDNSGDNGTFGIVCQSSPQNPEGIDPAAKWMWYLPNGVTDAFDATGVNTFKAFLIFRVTAGEIGTCPAPTPVVTSPFCQPTDHSGGASCHFGVTTLTNAATCTCSIDGVAPPDGSGTDCTPTFDCSTGPCIGTEDVSYEQLSPWLHQVNITCTDGGTPGIGTTTVPIANGDGHVVLLGADYSDGPDGPTGPFTTAMTTLAAAGGSALSGSFTPVNGFTRTINVLGVVIPNADPTMTVDPTEKENALSSLDAFFGTTSASRPWYTEINDLTPTTLEAALPGKDVVLIFDQHNPDLGPTVIDAWLQDLQNWIIGGGVIVVLDGGGPPMLPDSFAGVPHLNYLMIAPSGSHTTCLLNPPFKAATNDGTISQCFVRPTLSTLALWERVFFPQDSEPVLCNREDGISGYHKVIVRCEQGSKGYNVVDSFYGSDSYGTGDCYLPYKTITNTLAQGGAFQILVEPGDYSAANGETSPITTGDRWLDGYRDAGGGPYTNKGERFHGNGCFPVELDAEADLGGQGSLSGIKVVSPAAGTGVSTSSGFNGDIDHDTVIGGAVGIDLADGATEAVNDDRVSGAGIGLRANTTTSDTLSEVDDSIFTGNTIGVELTGADLTYLGPNPNDPNDDEGNIFSCNTGADIEIDGTALTDVTDIPLDDNYFDDVPMNVGASCTGGFDICIVNDPSDFVDLEYSPANETVAPNACPFAP